RRRNTRSKRDWSSDVCSSDLYRNGLVARAVSEASGIPWLFEVRGLMEQTWIASHRSAEGRATAERSEKVRRIIATESGLAREARSEEHTSELQSRFDLVCRLL